MPAVPPIAHVTLTVRDLNRSMSWYQTLFGTEMFLDETPGPFRRAVWLVEGQTLIGFHQFPGTPDAFSERRIGLDHLAFGCSSRAEIEAWSLRLEELGIANGGIVDVDYGSALSFRDPDGIALELFAPPA